MESSKKIVTRFAPSPTGFLHIGGVRTALFAWAFARKHGGTFILRIEDTDKAREVAGSIDHIIESLKWVGISWDEGVDIGGPNAPYLQSQRLDSYKKYAQILVDKGLAYADPYTPEEVEVFRQKAQEEKRPFLFREHRPGNPPVWDGTQPLRFKVTDVKTYHWNDLVYGSLSAGPEALDDFILIKSDGYPTYNLSHMIDDLEMGVTHIMRADEFIASTPKFLALYEALEITPPAFATLPPIMAPDGKKKLGKRDGAKDILDYKAEGYLPQAMLNFLVFIGWNPGGEKEILTPSEFIALFDIAKIHRSGGGFNEDKLQWFNREHMKLLSQEEFWGYAHHGLFGSIVQNEPVHHELLKKIEPLLRERMTKFSDMQLFFGRADGSSVGEFDYFFVTPKVDEKMLIGKELRDTADGLQKTKEHLKALAGLLEAVSEESWDVESIKSAVWEYADKEGRGAVLWPMRVALSGREKSPDPFELASILGKTETLKRLTF